MGFYYLAYKELQLKSESYTIVQNAPIESESPFQAGYTLLLGFAHAAHDIYKRFLTPLLPLIIEQLALAKTEAGLLVVFMEWPSILQPFIGRIADRKNLQRIIFILPALTGIFMSLIGIAPDYVILSLVLTVGGISSAIFHAVAPPVVGKLAGSKIGRGLSIWMVGGELGWMLGPLVIIGFVTQFGMLAMPWMMILGILSSIVLFFLLRNISDSIAVEEPNGQPLKDTMKEITPIILPILAIVLTRSFERASFDVFLPIYLTERGASLFLAGSALTILMAFGIVGTLLGGSLKDSWGGRNIMLLSVIGTTIFMFAMINSSGWVQIAFIGFLGFFSAMILPIALAMVQEFSPKNRSFSNGLYLALLFAINALAGLGVGYMADLWGIQRSFFVSAMIGLVGLPFIFLLPKGKTSKGENA